MNSRQRRKQEAKEHNARPALLQELRYLRSAIHAKHGAWVQVVVDSGNDSVRREIAKLLGIFEADTPPRKVAVAGGSGRLRSYQKLAMIAAMELLG